MSYLLYCIVHQDHQEPRIRFLGYPRASIMVREAGLAAVVSKLANGDLAPDVPRLLVYAKIVESFNRDRTVVPMRYGCTFAELAEIANFLELHRQRYSRLLEEVDGRVEMSARAVLRNPVAVPMVNGSPPVLMRLARNTAQPGAAYLTERRRYYASKDELEKRREEVRKRVCAVAEGKFIGCVSESARPEDRELLSMHFLVPRHGIGSFGDALRLLAVDPQISVAVTGPWPPYNFVCPVPAIHPNSS